MCLNVVGPTASGSSSLDPSETSEIALAAPNGPQHACHREHFAGWVKVQNALHNSPDTQLRKRAQRINGCCLAPMLLLTDKGRVSASPGYCRDRMCPTCQQRRSRVVAARCGELTVKMDSPRFLTVTQKAKARPLFLTIAALCASFRQLRKTPEWKAHVHGGVYVLEVTLNDETGLWHAHIHVIFDGVYWDQRAISKLWLKVTGDSPVVDVRAVHSRQSAANYVAKYVAKPTGMSEWPDEALREFADALHGQRMVHTFGESYAVEVEPENAGETKVLAEPLVPVSRVIHWAFKGDAYARFAVDGLARESVHTRRLLGRHAPQSVHPLPPMEEWERQRLVLALRQLKLMMPDDKPNPRCSWDAKIEAPAPVLAQQLDIWWIDADAERG